MKNKFMYLFVTVFLATLVACGNDNTADNQQQVAQAALEAQGAQSVGMPSIIRFEEKRQLKDIYELRDKMIPTITYILDLNGHTHKLCDSVGYGIPYATQYTNPQKVVWSGNQSNTTSQADPNGLFSPSNADGTWIKCINPVTHKQAPLYVEPRVIVSPFSLD